MSLIVHLPLNGTTKQIGLSSLTFAGSPSAWNNGKIGRCAYWNGSVNNVIYNNTTELNYTENFSVALWINPVRTGTNTQYAFTVGRADMGGYGYGLQVDSATQITFRFGNKSIAMSVNSNEWSHVAMIVGASDIKVYKNGTLYTTTAIATKPTYSDGNGIGLGCFHYSSNTYPYYGSMNDFRIYDHCLSQMEVKRLSQGLVLHYPLNRGGWGQENLVKDSNTFAVGSGASGITPSNTADGLHQVIAASGNNNWHSSWATSTATGILESTFSEGDKFTVSFTIKSDNANTTTPPTIYIKSGMGYYPMIGRVTSDWSTVYYSGTWKDTNGIAFHLGFGGLVGTYLFKNWKVEKGDKPTPWCPNSSDALATTLGMNNGIEYDCSGFGNNGEYYAYDSNGSITYTSDTPKFNTSTHIASGSATANSATGTRYLYGHCALTNPTEMSVAFWLKPINGGYGDTMGHGFFCTTMYDYGNINVGYDYQGSAMNNRDSAIDINDSSSTTQLRPIFQPVLGEWHHYVITYDGQSGKVYTDGIQTSSAQFSSARTLDSFIGVVIGFSKAGGVWRKNDACYSDFRIYATALSADDVKALYNNAAYIDNQSNVYAADYIETSNTALNSQGVFNTLEINEETDQAMIKDSGELYSPDFYEI